MTFCCAQIPMKRRSMSHSGGFWRGRNRSHQRWTIHRPGTRDRDCIVWDRPNEHYEARNVPCLRWLPFCLLPSIAWLTAGKVLFQSSPKNLLFSGSPLCLESLTDGSWLGLDLWCCRGHLGDGLGSGVLGLSGDVVLLEPVLPTEILCLCFRVVVAVMPLSLMRLCMRARSLFTVAMAPWILSAALS